MRAVGQTHEGPFNHRPINIRFEATSALGGMKVVQEDEALRMQNSPSFNIPTSRIGFLSVHESEFKFELAFIHIQS